MNLSLLGYADFSKMSLVSNLMSSLGHKPFGER